MLIEFKDFTGEFFCYLNLIADILNGLEDRDAIARFRTRCLSAVSVYDNTLENVETLDDAQAKFDDILDSPSIDVACEKIKSLVKCPLTTIKDGSWDWIHHSFMQYVVLDIYGFGSFKTN
ncbi:hypothetical protein HN51_059170, partial [Arachis hypogaea]